MTCSLWMRKTALISVNHHDDPGRNSVHETIRGSYFPHYFSSEAGVIGLTQAGPRRYLFAQGLARKSHFPA